MNMKGFTLIESLVAVTILMIALVGPVSVMHRTYSAAYIAKDKLTASYLAQEGVEYVRAERDNAYLANQSALDRGWSVFLSRVAACSSDDGSITCSYSPTDLTTQLKWCNHDTPTPFFRSCAIFKPGDIYDQDVTVNSERTAFARKISISQIPPSEVKVVSSVTWVDHGTTYDVTITDHLTQWQ